MPSFDAHIVLFRGKFGNALRDRGRGEEGAGLWGVQEDTWLVQGDTWLVQEDTWLVQEAALEECGVEWPKQARLGVENEVRVPLLGLLRVPVPADSPT